MTMARDAAPHSSASICMMTGTFAAPRVTGAFTFFPIASPQFHTNASGATCSTMISAV